VNFFRVSEYPSVVLIVHGTPKYPPKGTQAFFPIELPPLVNGADADAHGASDVIWMLATQQMLNRQFSAFRRQAGILRNIHKAFSLKPLSLQTSASQMGTERTIS
jgi:hypothetical protein